MKVIFCGVGAVGSAAATLCRTLPVMLSFVDFRRVQPDDLLTHAYSRQSVGENRAEALRLQLRTCFGVDAQAYPVRLTTDNVVGVTAGADLLVDCQDTVGERRVVLEHAAWTGTPSVHAGVSGSGDGVVCWGDRYVADMQDEPGNGAGERLPFVGLLAGTLATVVADFVRSGVRREATIIAG